MIDRRMLVGGGVCALVIALVLLFAYWAQPPAKNSSAVPQTQAAAGTQTENNEATPHLPNLFIGQCAPAEKIDTVLSTRRNGSFFQAMVRYEPKPVPVEQVPDAMEILTVLAQRGQPMSPQVIRVHEETEVLADTLGEPVRSITVYRAYFNPLDGRLIAYDLISTSGGQPQRSRGHISRHGMMVETSRCGRIIESREVPLTPETFVPPGMEFIHSWYLNNKDALARREPVKFHIFIPAYTTTVLMAVKPLGDQVIPVNDATYDCAHYEVQAASGQSADGARARQEFWFDKQTGLLMRRQDTDASLKPDESPVTERVPPDRLESSFAQIRPLQVVPPVLPNPPFPYPLNRELTYSVSVKDEPIGRVRLEFGPSQNPARGVFVANATVTIDAQQSSRHETAQTFFDKDWRPLSYFASGQESAEMRADYTIKAILDRETLKLAISRQLSPLQAPEPPPQEAAAAKPAQTATAADWQPPLRHIPVSDEDAREEEKETLAAQLTHYELDRKLSAGTFLWDFNRIEQLAVLAHRLPLEALTAAKGKAAPVFQPVALYSVRQNRCGLVSFEISLEPKPVLTERQKRRLSLLPPEPQLCVATCNAPLLPSRMLLTPDGRILQFTLKYGSSDVTYTLDDPIMRTRAERAKRQQLQQGPQLIRPPWW